MNKDIQVSEILKIVANANLKQSGAMVRFFESIEIRKAYLTDFERDCLREIVKEGIELTDSLRKRI